MNNIKKSRLPNNAVLKKQRGQAMVEFSIAAAFVVVPLLLMIPVLGKYMDINNTSVQMARFVIWERSVWHDKETHKDGILADTQVNLQDYDGEYEDGVATTESYGDFPFRDNIVIQNHATRHFLSAVDASLDTGGDLEQVNYNTLWRNPTEQSEEGAGWLLRSDDVQITPNGEQQTQGKIMVLLNDALDIINDDVLGTLGLPPLYQLNLDSFYTSCKDYDLLALDGNCEEYGDDSLVSLTVTPPAVMQVGDPGSAPDTLSFEANGALLVDGWNAQSIDNFTQQTRRLVPSSLLNFEFFNDVRDIAAQILRAPELGPDNLVFGQIGFEPIKLATEAEPGDSNDDDHDPNKNDDRLCTDAGLCDYAHLEEAATEGQ